MTNHEDLVDEVRAVREAHAARYSNDLKRIFIDIRSQQEASGRQYETLPPRRSALASLTDEP
jgi:hypothetical protein